MTSVIDLAPAEGAANREAEQDAAWVQLNTPLPVEAMLVFCGDIERLFRINPMLEFKRSFELGNNQYHLRGRNISQTPPFDFDVTLNVRQMPSGYEILYDSGIKSRTLIEISPAEQGSQLKITDFYENLSPEQRAERLAEVDKSLVTWGKYLQQYLLLWHRWSRFRPWRWYMRRIWQPMKPISRRITYILLWITAVELALIGLGAAIYFVEYT